MEGEPDFIAELSFRATEEGGRRTAAFSGYRPAIKFPIDEMLTSGQQVYLGQEHVAPGETVKAKINILSVHFFKGRLREGMEFEFVEGAKVIGTGRILELVNSELKIEEGAMNKRIPTTQKQVAIKPFGDSKKYWMTDKEYTGILVGKEVTHSEYVISEGIIEPQGFVPDHYHRWEDQTFHVITGHLEAKIGEDVVRIGPGDTIHCPRGISHYMKNIGEEPVRLISYIFPGDWAEDFMAETSRQVTSGKPDLALIEEKFGVVYL